jgi:hypothetical protein
MSTETYTEFVEINTATPVRWTNYSQHLELGGETYFTRAFDVSNITQASPSAARASLVIDNRDLALSVISFSEGLTGKSCKIYGMNRLGDDSDWLPEWAIIDAQIRGAEGDDIEMSLEVGPTGWRSGSLLTVFSVHCCHKVFGGNRCQYVGPETNCNRSWTRCEELGNTEHFVGLRYAVKPGETMEIGATGSEAQQSPVIYHLYPRSGNQREKPIAQLLPRQKPIARIVAPEPRRTPGRRV